MPLLLVLGHGRLRSEHDRTDQRTDRRYHQRRVACRHRHCRQYRDRPRQHRYNRFLPSLAIGTYTVTIDHAGFSKTVTTVVLNVDENLRLNLALKVGTDTQAVNVEADSGSLETTNASITGTFENAQISELPINGRDYGRFTLLTPGAVLRTSQIADITFNGMQSTNNQFTIDGIDATRIDGAYLANGSERGARLLTGSLDTIAEFKSLSSNYTADYGRATGGVVNIVTKSGANAIHGGVYDYVRNDLLRCQELLSASGAPQPPSASMTSVPFSAEPSSRIRCSTSPAMKARASPIGLVGGGLVLSPAKIASPDGSAACPCTHSSGHSHHRFHLALPHEHRAQREPI